MTQVSYTAGNYLLPEPSRNTLMCKSTSPNFSSYVHLFILRMCSSHLSQFECTYPWTARRSNQSILKEISPGCSSEGMMLKLKLQYFGHFMQRVDSLEKTDAGRDWGQEEKGMTEDEMAG